MTDTTMHPQTYKRRSFVYRKLLEMNPGYIEINDGVMVSSTDAGDAQEIEQAIEPRQRSA